MLPASDVTITNSVALPLFLPRGRSGKIYVSVARFPKGQMALYARANRLQAVSRAVADAIKVQSPSMYERVRVLPNTLSETFSNLPAEAHGERKREILYIGRIAREKGLHLLIRAFHLIADPDDWTLTLLGPYEAAAGGDGDEYLDELRRICPARSGNIRFEEPIYDEHRLAQRLKSAAIFVYPSIAERGESFGMAPLEAMACGCAVLVSALECFRDFVVEGENALTFDHRDATGTTLARSLERLIADSTLRTRLGTKAIQTAMSFRSANVAPLFISDFSELLLQNAPQ
jgi:glycosyltransferase involved in cell wall biosynthesis